MGRQPMPEFVHKVAAGRLLELLRADRRLTQGRVAAACGWSQTKVVNVEQGAIRVRADDLEKLFAVLEPGEEDRRRITEHVEAGRASLPKSDFRWKFTGDPLRKVVDMERSAAVMRCHSGMFVPGLLQTEQYMRHHYRAFRPPLDTDEIERLVELRSRRQDVLDNPDQRFAFNIDEAALRRMTSMPGAQEQMSHLRAVSRRPNVELHVVPFTHGYYRGQEAEYSIFRYDADPTIHLVYVERYDDCAVLDEPRRVKEFLRLWEEQLDAALGSHETDVFLGILSGAYRSS